MHSTALPYAEKPHTRAPHKLDQQIADFLLSLIPAGRPRRLARMSRPGEVKREKDKAGNYTGQMIPRDKYEDITGELTHAMLANHAAGKVTYSYTLDKDGQAKIGVSDVDQGGAAALLALLKAALELGVTAFAIENTGKGKHQGGHLICLFDVFQAAADIKAIDHDVRARFDEENNWSDLLGAAGGTEMRSGYWACNCGVQHTHDIQIAVTSQDKIVSYSPNCKWVDQGKALDKFGWYVDHTHGGNYRAALEAKAREYGIWIDRTKRTKPTPEEPQPVRTQTSEQAADAARKRLARQREAVETRDAVLGRAAIDDDMPWQSRDLLDVHLQIAGKRGWHQASNARMAEMASALLGKELSERWIQRANVYLIDNGYITRTQTDTRSTAKWTLQKNAPQATTTLEIDNEGVTTVEADSSGLSPEYSIKESNTESLKELVRGGGNPAICEAAEQPVIELDDSAIAERLERLSYAAYVRNLAADQGIVLNLIELDALSLAELEAKEQLLIAEAKSDSTESDEQPIEATEPATASSVNSGAAAPAQPRLAHQDAPQIAPVETSDEITLDTSRAFYNPALDSVKDNPAQYSAINGMFAPKDRHTFRRKPADEALIVAPDAIGDDGFVQLDSSEQLDRLDQERPVRPGAKRSSVSAIDKYRASVALMSETELAGELKKQLNIKQKHSAAPWIASVHERIAVLQAEIDQRPGKRRSEHKGIVIPPPHKLTGNRADQTLLFQQGV